MCLYNIGAKCAAAGGINARRSSGFSSLHFWVIWDVLLGRHSDGDADTAAVSSTGREQKVWRGHLMLLEKFASLWDLPDSDLSKALTSCGGLCFASLPKRKRRETVQ